MRPTAGLSNVFSGRLTRKADNAALYFALTEADRAHEIGEQMGYSAESGYRLICIDHDLNSIGGDEFEIALVDDAQSRRFLPPSLTDLNFTTEPTQEAGGFKQNSIIFSASERLRSILAF